uniref:TLK2 n=1 Tax=Macrostomum lignano TaxID=282301 RepID=A0A1I8FF30_9PLAT
SSANHTLRLPPAGAAQSSAGGPVAVKTAPNLAAELRQLSLSRCLPMLQMTAIQLQSPVAAQQPHAPPRAWAPQPVRSPPVGLQECAEECGSAAARPSSTRRSRRLSNRCFWKKQKRTEKSSTRGNSRRCAQPGLDQLEAGLELGPDSEMAKRHQGAKENESQEASEMSLAQFDAARQLLGPNRKSELSCIAMEGSGERDANKPHQSRSPF